MTQLVGDHHKPAQGPLHLPPNSRWGPFLPRSPSTPLALTTKHATLVGLVGSLLLHLLLLIAMRLPPRPLEIPIFNVSVDFPPPTPRYVSEPLEKSTEKIKSQIVTPPNQPPSEAPPRIAHRLSDDNFETKIETIRRGDDPKAGIPETGNGSKASPKKGDSRHDQNPPPASSRNDAEQIRERPENNDATLQPLDLKLDQKTMLTKFGVQNRPPLAASEKDLVTPLQNYRAFSRPQGSGAAILGIQGNTDYLPNLPDGDLTFLNAKADRFAVFVRRVATQVFAQLRQAGWETLASSDIQAISEYATVTAILNPKGELKSVAVVGFSGSNRFDQVVEGAVRRGSRDPNPPKEATASDGNYHFVFKAKSWAQTGAGAKGLFERRWLILATGLD